MASRKRDRIRRQLEAYALLCERCAVCHWPKHCNKFNRVITLHHIVGRRGLDPHDHRNLLAVCQRCHSAYHDGDSRYPLTMGHLLTCKEQEDGEVDLGFLAKLMHRAGLREDPLPLPAWVHEERTQNEKLLRSREKFIERGE